MRPELERARQRIVEAAEDATSEAAEDLLGRAVPLAPIGPPVTAEATGGTEEELEAIKRAEPGHPGLLRASGHVVEGARLNPEIIVMHVVFSTVYAARQHEEVTWKHPQGGQAKYLEAPLLAMWQRYSAFIAARIRRVTGA